MLQVFIVWLRYLVVAPPDCVAEWGFYVSLYVGICYCMFFMSVYSGLNFPLILL